MTPLISTPISMTETLARLRLLHLVSPSLPVGAFTYSQGLEWAVECGWVSDEASLGERLRPRRDPEAGDRDQS